MSDTIIAGAYVIRNKKTLTVLHIEKAGPKNGFSGLSVCEQDERRFTNQQIWWIEPLPDYEDHEPERGTVYSITNPASGKALDINPGEDLDKSYGIVLHGHHAEPWQRWRIIKVDDDGGTYYTIASAFNGHVIDIVGGNKGSETTPRSKQYAPGDDQQCWEFVTPIVGFPAGWFQIQNVGTGGLLRHTYLHNPATIRPPPVCQRPSQYRESLEFQWTLVHTTCHRADTAAGSNSWRIINRLTQAHLSPRFWVVTPKTLPGHGGDLDWQLDLDPSYNWKIRNRRTSCLLEERKEIHPNMTVMRCDDRKFTMQGGSKSWVLRPPTLHIGDSSPPEYGASVDCMKVDGTEERLFHTSIRDSGVGANPVAASTTASGSLVDFNAALGLVFKHEIDALTTEQKTLLDRGLERLSRMVHSIPPSDPGQVSSFEKTSLEVFKELGLDLAQRYAVPMDINPVFARIHEAADTDLKLDTYLQYLGTLPGGWVARWQNISNVVVTVKEVCRYRRALVLMDD